jgi:hypothetical protein
LFVHTNNMQSLQLYSMSNCAHTIKSNGVNRSISLPWEYYIINIKFLRHTILILTLLKLLQSEHIWSTCLIWLVTCHITTFRNYRSWVHLEKRFKMIYNLPYYHIWLFVYIWSVTCHIITSRHHRSWIRFEKWSINNI